MKKQMKELQNLISKPLPCLHGGAFFCYIAPVRTYICALMGFLSFLPLGSPPSAPLVPPWGAEGGELPF